MRFSKIFGAALSLSSLFLGVALAKSTTKQDPTVLATAAFPGDNAINQVVNGQRNTLILALENKSGLNVTLVSIAGTVNHPDTGKLVKRLTPAKYAIALAEDKKVQVPFVFYSEFKPGEYRLTVWAEHSVGDKKYRVDAYESIVTIIEPEFSVFDIKLLLTYLIVAGILGGAGYLAYDAYVPQKKKTKRTAPTVSAPVTVTATGAGGYQEEWIPEHHFKKTKTSKKAVATSSTSGDELSGAEVSGTEGKKRKGKKN